MNKSLRFREKYSHLFCLFARTMRLLELRAFLFENFEKPLSYWKPLKHYNSSFSVTINDLNFNRHLFTIFPYFARMDKSVPRGSRFQHRLFESFFRSIFWSEARIFRVFSERWNILRVIRCLSLLFRLIYFSFRFLHQFILSLFCFRRFAEQFELFLHLQLDNYRNY